MSDSFYGDEEGEDDGFYAPDRRADEGDSCGEAVMAAMQAISDHCDADGVPMQMSSGMVHMVPQEAAEEMSNMAPGDMTDRELMEFIEASPWMNGIIERSCGMAGLNEGTRDYRECALNYARDLLGGE